MAPYLPPSRIVPLHAARQASAATATVTVTVTSTPDARSGAANLTGGAIAGIVIGSVVGVLLLIWIVRSCFNLGGPTPTPDIDPWYGRHEPKHHHRHHHHHRRPRSSRRSRSSSITLPTPVVVRQETRSRGRRPSASRSVYI